MCLAIPGKVVSISRDKHAVVSFNGVRKSTNIELVSGMKSGDWVTVHAGFAIGKLTVADAKKNQELINDYESGLRKQAQKRNK